MKPLSLSALLAALSLCSSAFAQQAQQGSQAPTAPPPPPPQVPPLNATITPNGVSIPVGDSKTVTIELNKLPAPQPGEKGGTVGVGVKF